MGARRHVRHPHFVIFLVAFPTTAAIASAVVDGSAAILVGFDLAASLFIALTLGLMRDSSPEFMRAQAARNDAGRGLLLAIAAAISAVVLVMVGTELGQAQRPSGFQVLFGVATLALAWGFANLVYALHYAHLYYDEGVPGEACGGLVFPRTATPDYWDLCYFAFTVGMTFQVSDVLVTERRMRRTVLAHALVAFAFNIGVLALMINVVSNAL